MYRRKLEELNLLDDFLFGIMVTYPGIRERFSRKLLKIICRRKFGKLTIVAQKIYLGSDTDKHGTRLDVYLEEKASETGTDTTADNPEQEDVVNATVYDVEPDKNDDKAAIAALPKRVRFYHAKIDGSSLQSGETYHALKNVMIIMITPYDPFGRNRMVYTIKNGCVEEPDMPYEDGARTIFLYTRGEEGNPPEELQQLLRYMEHSTEENACNEDLKELHRMVEEVKHDGEVSIEYMKIFEREEMLRKQGYREGEIKNLIQLVSKKVKRGQDCKTIATALESDEVYIQNIIDVVNRHAPEYDIDAIYEELK
ncbi:MAG: hypothetical protein PHS82_12340 [Lachnospiraceae bacterium]|nr:hypothetical protein [Lachnospiraceae bacterium]